jgi:hypothetical protein
MTSRTYAAEDRAAIRARMAELAKEREEARCTCTYDGCGCKVTDPRCEVHGTPLAPE